MSFKSKFIDVMAPLAGRIPSFLMEYARQGNLILPFYHLVANEPRPHIRHLYAVKSVDAFRQDVDYCLSRYQPIGLEELYALSRQGKQPARPSVLFSFDDGLREVYDWAAPILLERGLEALVFVNSAFVDNRALFFRYQASLLVEALLQADAAQLQKVRAWASGHQLKVGSDPRFTPLQVHYGNRAALAALALDLGVDFDSFLAQEKPYLSQAQLRELAAGGFHIGAHSVDHPLYAGLEEAEQWRQTLESLQYVSDNFSPLRSVFSFPFTDHGVSAQFIHQLLEGPDAPVHLLFGCAGHKLGSRVGHWQRIPMETGHLSAREVLHTEFLYSFVKRLATLGSAKML